MRRRITEKFLHTETFLHDDTALLTPHYIRESPIDVLQLQQPFTRHPQPPQHRPTASRGPPGFPAKPSFPQKQKPPKNSGTDDQSTSPPGPMTHPTSYRASPQRPINSHDRTTPVPPGQEKENPRFPGETTKQPGDQSTSPPNIRRHIHRATTNQSESTHPPNHTR